VWGKVGERRGGQCAWCIGKSVRSMLLSLAGCRHVSTSCLSVCLSECVCYLVAADTPTHRRAAPLCDVGGQVTSTLDCDVRGTSDFDAISSSLSVIDDAANNGR